MPRRGYAYAALLAAVVGLGVPGTIEAIRRSLGPLDLTSVDQGSTIAVDREGRLLRAFTTTDGRWRLPVATADVDPRFLDMLIAYEDRRFREHWGVDPIGIVRSVMVRVQSGHWRQGGSTTGAGTSFLRLRSMWLLRRSPDASAATRDISPGSTVPATVRARTSALDPGLVLDLHQDCGSSRSTPCQQLD